MLSRWMGVALAIFIVLQPAALEAGQTTEAPPQAAPRASDPQEASVPSALRVMSVGLVASVS